jgi:hypothetical protein
MVFTGMDLPHGTRYASQPATGDHNSGQPPTGNQSAPVAQLDRVPPSEGGGHRFESCRARHLKQWLTQHSRFALLPQCDQIVTHRSPEV